jgi:putative flippase GtrA
LFSVFKGISFIIAATHSYFWNKYWVFEAGATKVSGQEFLKFFSVTLIAFFINVAVASVIVNFVGPRFGLTLEAWANVGAIVGSGVALVASFTGYKKTVF